MNEAQAVALAEKHGASINVTRLHCLTGDAIVQYPEELAAMLTDHRAQVIEELAQQTGVMPASSPIHDAVYDVVIGHGYRGNEVREALAIMQARVEKLESLLVKTAEVNAKMTREKYPFVHLRMDVSEAEKEGALRDKLKELGWATPEDFAIMQAKLEQAQADAARYLWLRIQHWVEPEATFRLGLTETDNAAQYEEELDAAIDAAMKDQA